MLWSLPRLPAGSGRRRHPRQLRPHGSGGGSSLGAGEHRRTLGRHTQRDDHWPRLRRQLRSSVNDIADGQRYDRSYR